MGVYNRSVHHVRIVSLDEMPAHHEKRCRIRRIEDTYPVFRVRTSDCVTFHCTLDSSNAFCAVIAYFTATSEVDTGAVQTRMTARAGRPAQVR